jgi:hypothetical protein
MMTGNKRDCRIHSMEALPDDIIAQTATMDAVGDIIDFIDLCGCFEPASASPRDPEVQRKGIG